MRATAAKTSSTDLGAEVRFFASQITPRIIGPLLLIALAIRISLGDWSSADALVVTGLIAVQPFTEWMIHVYILHWKPKTIFGRTIDPLIARKHREHHSDPKKTEWIFIPLPVLLRAMPATAALFLVIFPTIELGMTAITAGLAILLTYEWTHYLIHSRYQPRSRLYRYIWRAHRLHHFKNENYWFGVTNPLGDHVLHTFPAKDDVPTSPTCKSLNGVV
ncbi:MAG: sterol desaturase family protein [Actinomycetota bacterium]